MKPFQAILRKESRQQGALALCMLLFCFILQLGTVNAYSWPWTQAAPQYFFTQSRRNRLQLLSNVLFAWYLEHGDQEGNLHFAK